MRKNLAILIVLVIGLVVFQGLVGFNQKQELLAKLLGKAMVEVTTESTEFNLKTQEDISKLKEDVYKSYVKENSLIDRYLPNYSELNIIEIIVNIGFILGIVFCLINIKRKSKEIVIDNVEAVKGLILYLIYSIILIIGTVVSAMFTIMYPEFWVITLTIIIYSIKELICITDILFYKD